MNSSEFLDSVTTESTGNEEVSAEKDEDVFNQELQALENADDKEDEDVHEVFRTAAEGIGNNEVHANKESNEKSSGSAMVHVAKTLQLASSWLNKTRAKRTENTPRVDSFLEKLEMAGPSHVTRNSRKLDSSASSIVIDPSGSLHYCWLIIVTISVLYNWIFIIARTAFLDLQINTLSLWLTLDYLSDIIYIVDMVIQFKTGFMERGLLVRDPKQLHRNYTKKIIFKLDCLSIIPLDLFYLEVGINLVALRFNRLLRLHRLLELRATIETISRFPNFLRLCSLIAMVLLIFHWNACFYFLLSKWIGFGSDTWVYPDLTSPGFDSLTRQYLFSLYWSSRMLTTGETENPPQTDVELFFVTVDLTVGFLVFAAIVGQFGSMITHMLHVRREFLAQADAVKQYLVFHEIDDDLQKRVVSWFNYMWGTKKSSLDRDNVLSKLPHPLRTEIAVQVHLETLKRVQVFADVEPGLLKEIVLKLRSQVYSPGDFICRKGEPGKEMYLVSSGRLQVVQDDQETVIATLNEGSYFGEISILNLSNTGNRRTANVRSEGYSELLCLSKEDLLEALTEYPEARKLLEIRGRRLLRRSR
ncbi:cyclic nucleotide-gated channel rod photoreceptor subunit alpha-like [Pocillopora verrucosa]|uniref:cyclic nucleotide-gated channel rod photoreceptor subunit alpha-like n=1 Tax=Pocillopora verrucosa TaxID=203993 RepID=UPI003341D9E4